MIIIVIKADIRMFLELGKNSGKLQIISGKFQNNALTTSNKFHLAMSLKV